jgi:hypothetical protein
MKNRRSKTPTTPPESAVDAAANRRRRLEDHLIHTAENPKLNVKQREKAATALQRLLSASQPKPPEDRKKKISRFQQVKAEALASLKGSKWEGLLPLPDKWDGENEGIIDEDKDDES